MSSGSADGIYETFMDSLCVDGIVDEGFMVMAFMRPSMFFHVQL